MERRTTHSSTRTPDMVVKEVPTMEAPTDKTGMTTESLGGMTVMNEPQMIMIPMIMMTMVKVAITTPPLVIATPYQAAATPNVPIQT